MTQVADPPAAPTPASPTPSPVSSHRLRYVVVGLVLVGAFAFLLLKGVGSALNYYLTADQAVAQRAQLAGKTINVEGVVEQGTIHSTPQGVDFTITAGGTHLAVQNTGSPPQLFQVNIPVVAVGHFSGSTFVSDQILVKHSSTYIAQHPNRVKSPAGRVQ